MTLPAIFHSLEDADVEYAEFEFLDVDDSDDQIEAWFDGKVPQDMRFTVFAMDATGGLYAIWQRNDETIDDAPVVLLGSEGEGVAIAKNGQSFLEAMSSGLGISPFDGQWYDELEHVEEEEDEFIEEMERRQRFQTWFKEQTDVHVARKPNEISQMVVPLTKTLNAVIESIFS